MAKKLAPRTLKQYKHGWRGFSTWCGTNGHKPLPASWDTLSLYVSSLIDTKKLRVASIRSRIAAVQYYHVAAKLPDPYDLRIAAMLAHVRKRRRERPRPKEAVTPEQVLAVLAANAGRGPGAARDRAIFSLLFATGWRSDELASLDYADISFVPHEGLQLSLGASKADQEGAGRIVAIPFEEDASICPVRLLEAWVRARGSEPGPLFNHVYRCGGPKTSMRLLAKSICAVVQQMLRTAGIENWRAYGAHSLRSGMITAAHLAGAGTRDIMHSTGQKSIETVFRYIRPLQGFRSYPLRGVLAQAKLRKATA